MNSAIRRMMDRLMAEIDLYLDIVRIIRADPNPSNPIYIRAADSTVWERL